MVDERLRIVGDGQEANEEAARAQLHPFTASANRHLDRKLAERSTRPVPVLRLPGSRRRIAFIATGVALAAAAAMVLLFIAPRQTDQGERERLDQSAQFSQASSGEDPLVAPSRAPVATGDEPSVEPEVDASTLEDLDAQAQRRWRSGDLEGAAKLLARVTTEGGDHRYVELAFADLVTLARQRGRAEQVGTLWREYLDRFPRGRFSVDARAVACAHADPPPVCSSP